MKKRVLFLCLAMLYFLPLINAEILISQPNTLYNLGDNLELNITLSSNKNINGFFSAKLICDSVSDADKPIQTEIEIFKSAVSLSSGEKKAIEISAKLDSSLIDTTTGSCYLNTTYASEEKDSQQFKISNQVKVDFNLPSTAYPNDTVSLTGNAIKENSQPLEGFVELLIPEINVKKTDEVINGSYSVSFIIPKNAPSGAHNLKLKAYEKDSLDELINFGYKEQIFTINPIITSLDIAANVQNVIPSETLEYKPIVLDQAGAELKEQVLIRIYSPSNQIIQEKIVYSGENQLFNTTLNQTPGSWTIKSKLQNLEKTKTFFIEESPKVSFVLKDGIVTITNIGNVPYDKPVEIIIGSTRQIKDVNLNLGESIQYRLTAPQGQYQIEAKDGNSSNYLGTSLLTGNAVAIKDINSAFTGPISWIIWFIIIAILAAIALYFYRKVRNKTYIGRQPRRSIPKFSSHYSATIPQGTMFSQPKKQFSISAQQDTGEKQEAVVINLKIKSNTSVEPALAKAKEQKARIYSSENNRIIIFSRATTSENENLSRAINAVKEMQAILNQSGASFGLGMNIGQMIVERSREGNIKFTSIGNVVTLAKKLSEISNNEIIISEQIHKRAIGKIRTQKLDSKNAYLLLTSSSKERYQQFANRFTEKQKKRLNEKKFE
jgi:hypothetical protein